MKARPSFSLFYLLATAAVVNCDAQQTSSDFNLSELFDRDDVTQELEMTEEQIADLQGLADDIGMEIRRAYLEITNPPEEPADASAADARIREAQQAVEQIRQREFDHIDQVLLPHQVKRLKELQIQSLGFRALLLNRLAEELELSDAQRQKIQEFATQVPRIEIVRDGRNLTAGQRSQILAERKAELEKQALSVLTPAQRQKFKQMQGEKFEFKVNQPAPDPAKDDDGQSPPGSGWDR